MIVLNAARQSRRLDLPVGSLLADGTILHECWSHETVRVERAKLNELVLRARAGRVFVGGAL